MAAFAQGVWSHLRENGGVALENQILNKTMKTFGNKNPYQG